MSSASSGRYQSRLFNFVHQQSRRLKQQSDRTLGNLRVAVSWVATVGLYPLYLVFQSTSSVAKQVNQAVQQSLPQLPANNLDSPLETPPTTDTPIQRVLQAVNALPSEEAIVNTSQDIKPANFLAFLVSNTLRWFKFLPSSPKSTSSLTHFSPLTEQNPSLTRNRPVIQGIATQLASRTLVLITAQNQILDIFTPQQQQKLQERIIDEVADYWRYQRLAHSGGKRASRGEQAEAEGRINPSGVLAILDRTVANLESKHLAPVAEVAIASLTARRKASTLSANSFSKRGWELVQRVQKLTVSLSGKIQPVGSKLPASATFNDAITLNGFESYKFRLQTLIFAAINYFFGSHSNKQAIAAPKNSTQAKPRVYQRSTFKLPSGTPVEQDPWLTLGDLFGEPELVGEPSSLEQHDASTFQTTSQLTGNTNLALPNSTAKYSLGNLRDRFWKFLPQSKQVSQRVSQQKTTKGKRVGEVGSKQLSPLAKSPRYGSDGQISNQRPTQNTQVEPKPDWIETNATAIGYVKHPLEKILEWLDRFIVWLEELLIKVLQRVQRLWQGK